METVEKIYDVIIVGSGPAGLTAALYTSRSNLETIVLDAGVYGGQLNNTEEIENYTGYSSIKGVELAQKMYDSSMQFGAEYAFGPVEKIVDCGDIKEVHTNMGKIYRTYAVIIATGSENKKLGVPGEETLRGRGVSYCAVCDGAFFRGKNLVVVGGGDSAVEEGTYLTQFANKVTIVHRRDQLRAQAIIQERAFANDKVDFIWDSVVEEISGDPMVASVKIRNVKTGAETDFPADGVFIYVGITPNTSSVSDLGITDDKGWIVTDTKMRTTIPGIYAVGDVRQTVLRQVATAVGDGSVAGHDVFDYLQTVKARTAKEITEA